MTVIIPSCLTSAFAADTKVSDLGLDDVSKAFEQSLTARGKHSPSRTWLRRWKTDSWMQLLFSRTFQLSHGSSSLRSWLEASCPLVGHASLSQQQENEKQRRTSGGSSTSLQMELPLFDQECFSQRTSKDSCPQKCQMVPVFSGTASRDWSGYITGLRQAYSARLNAVRHTSGSESLSWPTVRTTDTNDGRGCIRIGNGLYRPSQHLAQGKLIGQANLSDAVVDNQKNWPSPVASEVRQGFQDRSRGMKGSQESLTTVVVKSWPTPNAADSLQGGTTQGSRKDPNLSIAVHGPPAPASSSTDGSRPESWQTATVSTGAHRQKDGSMTDKLDRQVNGKLNPRWVETLMGLPVGWTMPSCVSPATIERTSSDCSGMGSCRQPQNEPSEC